MKFIKLAALAALCLPLGSCFFAPGKFNSTLELRRDGRFSFAYTGEVLFFEGTPKPTGPDKCYGPVPEASNLVAQAPSIVRTVPSRPAPDDEGQERADVEFDVDSAMEERPCTSAELAQRREQRDRQRKDEAAMLSAVVGFDPTDPRSVQAYIAELRRYPGWRSVVHKGGNRFEVDYRASGTTTHDFLFPVFDNVIVHTPFVTMRPRADGSAEVRAPAFGGNAGGSWMALMGMGNMPGVGGPGANNELSQLLKATDGTFTLVTDGEIRTNNTAEGPTTRGGDKVLSWRVTTTAKEAPRALVQLR